MKIQWRKKGSVEEDSNIILKVWKIGVIMESIIWLQDMSV